MSYPPGINPWNIDHFKNAHNNFTQQLDADRSFDLHLQDPSWKNLSQIRQYNLCTDNLKWIIKKAIETNMAVRAMGSGWSLSKVAVSDDTIINTKRLRHKFKLSSKNFNKDYLDAGNKPEDHYFLQCGNTVIDINEFLEKELDPAKCLRASGGSNGQTIVGAFSTNTHGAALYYGALQEMILGLHIVTGPDSHYYLERQSKTITSEHFHNEIGATVILDDDLFNAALVSFGSFGIIHGVLIEVEDKYLLEQKLTRVSYDDDLDCAVSAGEFSRIDQYFKYPINDMEHPLYHFELAINPHDFEFGSKEKGAYMRAMHKVPYRNDYIRFNPSTEGYTYGDDTLGLIQSVLDGVEASAGFLNRQLIPKIVNALFDMAYDRPDEATGTIGETFRNTVFRGKLFSAAFGLDRKDVTRVIEHCLSVNREIKLAGVLAFRFVRGTNALLGFTRFENTCVMEIDGVDASVNHRFVNELVRYLEQDGIHFTMHWGKINRILTPERVEKMYGKDKVTLWKKQRSRILAPEVQRIFNNEFLEQCGLDRHMDDIIT